MEVNWRDRHYGHIRVWNTRARSLCPGARLEGDMSSAHPYFDWYDRVTWRFVDHTSASLIIMVASHKKLLKLYTVGSPEYNHISAILKTVERLHRITARLPLEDIDGANPEAPEDTGRPSTSSTRASHSHGQRAASHQVVSRADLPPPPCASPAPEFPPPPHASPSPEIPPHTAHAVSDLDISLPTTHASFHPEIPSHTSHTFFDPAHLSFTPPSFDLGPDFNQTPPVMHTQSPSYNIGHIDHVPPHSHSMSFMPTPRLHIDPMSTGTHISFATPSSPAVVGSQAKQPAVHVENEQVVGLQSPPQGRPKRTMKAPPCGTSGHKAGHNAGPTVGPENASQVILSSPVLNEGELESLLNDPSLKPQVLPTFFDIRKGVDGSLEKTLNIYSEAADEAVRNGSQLLVLSDRSDVLEPTRLAVPILLAVGAVHQHLIQNGLRMSASIVAETAQCFSTHQFACLVGFGASAICPYLALETCRQWRLSNKTVNLMRNGKMPTVTIEQAQKNFCKAVKSGLLKILSKMGISLLSSYCGAQIFEIYGLGKEIVDLSFCGSVSKIGGLTFDEVSKT
ncbi:uncharacterized protein LOC115986090 [Quercus lobata]|uniref:uncharacterized protein LOC115985114 n=1 Tax=Quercus lobata TaxID=97700 RepID=UPI00124520B4|nr:uncharacterized protein LOC115985114 [Quercus lobata]XP_030964812.1 uncharacterized protein LOC115986090 [Quercus lobata]